MKYERLTTNNVQSNLQSLLNYAYDKDGEVYLRYANGEEDKRLAEYIAELATEKGCERTADDVIDDGCVECDCEVAILNAVAIQAAELRHRLAELEDKIESGKMSDLPYGDKVWIIDYDDDIVSYVCVGGNKDFLFLCPTVYAGKDMTTPEELCNYYVDCYMDDGDDADIVIFPRNKCFTDKHQAEARLKELQGE